MKKLISIVLMVMLLCACCVSFAEGDTRVFTDALGREVEIPQNVDRIVCAGVGALRYVCYMGAQDTVVGVEEHETEAVIQRLYTYVNHDQFSSLPVIGMKDEPDAETIIQIDPQVIVLSAYLDGADALQEKTGIPVVVVPGSDTTLDDKAYETIRMLGELLGREEKAAELTAYLKGVAEDLESRTANIPDSEKPSVYVCGVSFKGSHGFEGTEAYYGPFELIHAKNLANETSDTNTAFSIDPEQVLSWDPEIIFVDYNGLSLIREDYQNQPDFYNALSAVQNGRVYAQISFRHCASNLETALADAYYAATVMYPDQFADVDPATKADEIFTELLGKPVYNELAEAGYVFGEIKIGE